MRRKYKSLSVKDINSIKALKDFYKQCDYGLIDFEADAPWNETHKNTYFEDWENHWRLLSPDQLLKFRRGICYDTARMNDHILNKLGVDHVNLFAYTKRSGEGSYDDDPTHTFTVYRDVDGRWRWLEGSWGPYKDNDWSENNADKLITRIGRELANNSGVTNRIGVISDWPEYGASMQDFYHALKDQAINNYSFEVHPDRRARLANIARRGR